MKLVLPIMPRPFHLGTQEALPHRPSQILHDLRVKPLLENSCAVEPLLYSLAEIWTSTVLLALIGSLVDPIKFASEIC